MVTSRIFLATFTNHLSTSDSNKAVKSEFSEISSIASKGNAMSLNLFSICLLGLFAINADSANVSTILSNCFSSPKFKVSPNLRIRTSIYKLCI